MELFKKINFTWLKKLSPVFLAVSFVVSVYLHNMGELFLSAIIRPLLVAILFTLALIWLLGRLNWEAEKKTLLANVLTIFFFSYGELVFVFTKFKWGILSKDYWTWPLWLLILLSAIIWIRKTKQDLSRWNSFFLLMSVVAVFLPSLRVAKFEISRNFLHPKAHSSLELPETAWQGKDDEKPDIYYIVPDSYASSEVLSKYFSYDNSSFVKFLEGKGFYVPTKSTSNYPKTFLSIASTLNMEYLDYLSVYKNSPDRTVVAPLINDNNVKKILNKQGYRYYQLGSWYELTHSNPLADSNFTLEGETLGSLDLFNYSILQSTVLKPFLGKIIPRQFVGNSDADGRNRNLYQFEKLPEIAKMPGPKFVFVHLISPHIPYVFGSNCEPVVRLQTDRKPEGENYTNQINCLNTKFQETIAKIMDNSKVPPIILLQSDEGVPFLRDHLPTIDEWGSADNGMLREKFPVFSAYYLPGVNSGLYESVSNVNSFRIILNSYFSANLPLLPDKNIIFTNTNNFYEFTDVTNRVNDG